MVELRDWWVVDLGGSIVCPPSGFDPVFLAQLRDFFISWLQTDSRRSLAVVVGGGFFARASQQVLRQLNPEIANEQLDWVGIQATHLNANILRSLLLDFYPPPVLTDYGQLSPLLREQRVVVGGGWKPGFSTDYDSVLLAEHLGVSRLYCLSNLAQIYTADPKLDPAARPLSSLDWGSYRRLIGEGSWRPGWCLPFDKVATMAAASTGMELVFVDGRDLVNLRRCIDGQEYLGTLISGNSC